ncbi:MAG TPA: SGNH/GDSL hydrolase family protein [Chthoniobacterales bacterium]|nr:SGNH/GDSL hydrolase family protein [Chthoniobacterales bacterium]
MTRTAITFLGLGICAACFCLATNGTARTGSAKRPATPPAASSARVLMIGDSLSVGAFGESVQRYLARRFGPQNVAAYASCGSSPEHWIASEPDFYTKCGYRESTPDKLPVYRDFVNGKAPRPTLTPKLEGIVRRYQPTVVVVQLGTNWMDRNLSDGQINSFLDRFVRSARGNSVRQIIWIEPPDSSAFRRTQGRIHRLIQQGATRNHFEVIDSRPLTHYVPGKTGGDGVHYNSEASRAWAGRINSSLDAKLRGQLVRNR